MRQSASSKRKSNIYKKKVYVDPFKIFFLRKKTLFMVLKGNWLKIIIYSSTGQTGNRERQSFTSIPYALEWKKRKKSLEPLPQTLHFIFKTIQSKNFVKSKLKNLRPRTEQIIIVITMVQRRRAQRRSELGFSQVN